MKSHPYPRSYWQLMASEADYVFCSDETPESLPLSGSWSCTHESTGSKSGLSGLRWGSRKGHRRNRIWGNGGLVCLKLIICIYEILIFLKKEKDFCHRTSWCEGSKSCLFVLSFILFKCGWWSDSSQKRQEILQYKGISLQASFLWDFTCLAPF